MKKLLSVLFAIFLLFSPVSSLASIDFDGSDDFATYGANQILDDPTQTMGCWVKIDAVTTDLAFIGNWETGNVEGFIFQFDDSGGCGTDRWAWFFREDSGVNGHNICGGTTVVADQWYSVIVTMNTSSAELFVDGVSDATSSAQGSGGTFCDFSDCNHTVYLGWTGHDTATRFFNGEIEDCFHYSTVLTDAQILQIGTSKTRRIQLQISPTTLTALNPMDDGAEGTSADGDTLADMSGNGNVVTGDNGAGNDNLLWAASEVLTYP